MGAVGSQVALGLGAAAAWGGADFSGGLAAKRAAPSLVVAVAHGLSLVALLTAATFLHTSYAGYGLYGLFSGVLCGGGLMMLYSALARGSMGLVAAISGVLTALVPVAFSLGREAWLRDGYTPAHRLAGFALAAAAIWLVAYTPSSGDETSAGALEGRSTFDSHGFALAVAAGLSFGTMLVLMHFAAAHGVLQGLIEMRITSTALAALAGAFLWFSKSRRTAEPSGLPKSRLLALAVVVGILDTAGNLFYLFASNAGRMDVAAVLSSLYPAGTMALAAWLLKERTSKSQAAGMALAIAAILLISA